MHSEAGIPRKTNHYLGVKGATTVFRSKVPEKIIETLKQPGVVQLMCPHKLQERISLVPRPSYVIKREEGLGDGRKCPEHRNSATGVG